MNNIIAEAGDWFKELGRVLTGRPTIQEFTATAAKYQDADKERTLPGTQVLMEKPQVRSASCMLACWRWGVRDCRFERAARVGDALGFALPLSLCPVCF